MGIPGFSGFAAEITILIGAWKTYPLAVWITGIGMVLVAAFTLRALRKTFFSDLIAQCVCRKDASRRIRIGMKMRASKTKSHCRKNSAPVF